MRKIIWFSWWEKGNHQWGSFQTTNCYMINLGRLSVAIQKLHTWKHL